MLIPAENEKDLADIPDNVKRGLKIIPARTVDEALQHALTEALTPIEWEDDTAGEAVLPAKRGTTVGIGYALTLAPRRSAGRGNPEDRHERGNPGELLPVRCSGVDPLRTGLYTPGRYRRSTIET